MNNTFDKNIIKSGGTYISCQSINSNINFWTDGLYFCCGSVDKNGVMAHPCMKKLNKDSILDDKLRIHLFEARMELIQKINSGLPNECQYCTNLSKREWLPLNENSNINFINIHADHLCNCNCTYCFQDHAERCTYDAEATLDILMKTNYINHDDLCHVNWAGGEPAISPVTEKLFNKLESKNNIKHSIEIYTSAIKFSQDFAERLNKTQNTSIIISIDAGTRETYNKIKRVDQFDKVLSNIKAYYDAVDNKSKIAIKYIMVEENSSEQEIDSFVKMIIDNNLTNCNFYLANDIYHQKLADKIRAGSYYFCLHMLNRIGKMPTLWVDSLELRNIYYNKLFMTIPSQQEITQKQAQIDMYVKQYKVNKIIKIVDYLIPKDSVRKDVARLVYKIAKLIYKYIKNKI